MADTYFRKGFGLKSEIEGALAATGRRVATALVVGYPPAAQCRRPSR